MPLDTRDPLLKAQDRIYWGERIARAVADERERCAKVAAAYRPGDNIAKAIAAKIRNLKSEAAR